MNVWLRRLSVALLLIGIAVSSQAGSPTLLGAGKFVAAGGGGAPLDGLSPTAAYSLSRILLTSFGAGTKYNNASGITDIFDQSGNARNIEDVDTNIPALSTTVGSNNRTGAVFDGVNDRLRVAVASSLLITASEGYIIISGVLQTPTLDAASFYDNDVIFTNEDVDFGVYTKLTGPTIGAMNWDGNGDVATTTFTAGLAFVAEWRHLAGNVGIRLNCGSWVQSASGNTALISDRIYIAGRTGAGAPGKFTLVEMATFSTVPASADTICADLKTYVGAP